MVQAGSPVDYDNGVDGKSEPNWTSLVRNAVKEFVGNVTDSSRQLVGAAERFASESLHLIGEATDKAREAAATSASMAEAARQSADEARRVAESMQAAVVEAVEKVRAEARETVDEAVSQARQAQELAERVKAELQEQVQEMVGRIERSANNSQEIVRAAQEASQEVRRAAERVAEAAASVDAAVALAQRAAEEARQAAERIDQSVSTVTAAVAGAQQAAEEAKRSAAVAGQAQPDVSLQDDTRSLITRLEEDYQLLTSLVQELAGRLGSLTKVAAEDGGAAGAAPEAEEATAPEPPAQAEPEFVSPWLHEAAAAGHAPEPEVPGWPRLEAATEAAPVSQAPAAPTYAEAAAPVAAGTAASMAPAEPGIGGVIEVTISPVPDFDRLLTLDGALGKLDGVRSVTLVNYAQEEVTFRVELEGRQSADKFADKLSEAAGMGVHLTEAGDTSLRMRLD